MLSELANLNFAPGVESEEVDLFSEEDIPQEKLCTSVVKLRLQTILKTDDSGIFLFGQPTCTTMLVSVTTDISDSSSQSIDRN